MISKEKKIIYLGTTKMSSMLLEHMILAGYNICCVVTKQDKPNKRGTKLEPSPVSVIAQKYNIPIYKPVKLNKEYDFIEQIQPDLLLTFAYGQIISDKVLSLSKYYPLNVHTSLLPKLRGSNPIQYALRLGFTETGISLIRMVKEVDSGDIYAMKKIKIEDDDNLTSLSEKLTKLSIEIIDSTLENYFENKIQPIVQNNDEATFTKMLDKEELIVDCSMDCTSFINLVRSVSYDYGITLHLDETNFIKIYSAHKVSDEVNHKIGQIIKANKKEFLVQFCDGVINFDELQKPGKKILKTVEFNNGAKDLEGKIFIEHE